MCRRRSYQNFYGNFDYHYQPDFPFVEKRRRNHLCKHEEFFNESESLKWLREYQQHHHHHHHPTFQEQPRFGIQFDFSKEKHPNYQHQHHHYHHHQLFEYQPCKPFKTFSPYCQFTTFGVPFELRHHYHHEGQLCRPFQSFCSCRPEKFPSCVSFRRQMQYKCRHHSHYCLPYRQYSSIGKQRQFDEHKRFHHLPCESFKSFSRFKQLPKQIKCEFHHYDPYHGLQYKQCPRFSRLTCIFPQMCLEKCNFCLKHPRECQSYSPGSGFREKKCDRCHQLPLFSYKLFRHHCERKEKKENESSESSYTTLSYSSNKSYSRSRGFRKINWRRYPKLQYIHHHKVHHYKHNW